MRFKNITGNIFGRLIAVQPTNERKNGCVVWKCKCSCGNEVFVSRANLEQGYVKSCGCLHREKISERNKLKQVDITNKRFGRLTAIEKTNKRKYGYVVWKCKCECGNYAYIDIHNLISSNTLSCGCLNSELAKENAKNNIANFKKENYIANTRLDIINKNKVNKNNKTGCTGVYYRKNKERYIAEIIFQGKRYYLGSFKELEDAIKVRKKAQEKLYNDFLEWYNSNKISKRRNE